MQERNEENHGNGTSAAVTAENKTKNRRAVDFLTSDWQKYTRTQIISINALLCAIVLLFVLVPLKIGVLDLAVIPIIAILISTEVLGLFNGMLTGLFFGLVSFLNHLLRHPSVLSDIFIKNPMITFFPRIMIGVTVFFTIKLLDYAFSKIHYKNEKSQKITPKILDTIKYAIGALIGVITNTAGVLGFMYLFYSGNTLASGVAISGKFILAIIATNSILEAAVCTVVTPAITIAVKKTLEYTMRRKIKTAK
jgi:uncharacterized membrane protein